MKSVKKELFLILLGLIALFVISLIYSMVFKGMSLSMINWKDYGIQAVVYLIAALFNSFVYKKKRK